MLDINVISVLPALLSNVTMQIIEVRLMELVKLLLILKEGMSRTGFIHFFLNPFQ